jgi:bla regulator protein BlaR1
MTSYLIKSILCSGILTMAYHLFLEREKMLRFNRFYLLLAVIFSLIIPSVSFEIKPDTTLEPVAAVMPRLLEKMQGNVAASPPGYVAQGDSRQDLMHYLPFIFYLATSLLLIRFIRNIWTILRLKSQCRTIPIGDAKLILVPQDIITYTFLNNVFIPEKSFENAQVRDEILTHELAHARQMHSLDILFIELVQVVMWFNPFLFFYKKAIRLNHEFLADEAVLREYTDVKSYQLLLLDTILYRRQVSLTSSFNYSITKKRLAMMTKIKNLNRQYVKQFAIALLAFVLTLTFSEKIYSQIEAGGKEVAEALPEIKIVKFDQAPTPKKTDSRISKTKFGLGLSSSEISEFYNTIEKYTTYVKNKKGRTDPMVRMSPKMEDNMHVLFAKMNGEQRHQAEIDSGILVFQMDIPVKKAPTPEIFENWKKADVFGVWINEKHVPNTELDKYKNTDIAEYIISKLYGGALKGRSYKYQLNISTNDYFDKNYQARVNDRVSIIRVGWVGERPKTFGKQR